MAQSSTQSLLDMVGGDEGQTALLDMVGEAEPRLANEGQSPAIFLRQPSVGSTPVVPSGGRLDGTDLLESGLRGAELGTGQAAQFIGRMGSKALQIVGGEVPGSPQSSMTRGAKQREQAAAQAPGQAVQRFAEKSHPAPTTYGQRFAEAAGGLAPYLGAEVLTAGAASPAILGVLGGSHATDRYDDVLAKTHDENKATQAGAVGLLTAPLMLAPLGRILGRLGKVSPELGSVLSEGLKGAATGVLGPGTATVIGESVAARLTGEERDALKAGLETAAIQGPLFALLSAASGVRAQPHEKGQTDGQTAPTLEPAPNRAAERSLDAASTPVESSHLEASPEPAAKPLRPTELPPRLEESRDVSLDTGQVLDFGRRTPRMGTREREGIDPGLVRLAELEDAVEAGGPEAVKAAKELGYPLDPEDQALQTRRIASTLKDSTTTLPGGETRTLLPKSFAPAPTEEAVSKPNGPGEEKAVAPEPKAEPAFNVIRYADKTKAISDNEGNIYATIREGKRRGSGQPFYEVKGYSRLAGKHADLEGTFEARPESEAIEAARSIAQRAHAEANAKPTPGSADPSKRGALDLFGPAKAVAETAAGDKGFDIPDENRVYSGMVDEFDRIVQIEKAAPNKASSVAGDTVETALSRMPGRRFGETEKAQKQIVEPMARSLREAGIPAHETSKLKVSASDFLYALHAKRRNEIMAERHPKKFGTDPGSGMSDAQADAIVARALSSPDRDVYLSLQKRNQAINKLRLDALESGGLISSEQRAEWEKFGEDYVPLKTAVEADPSERFVGASGLAISGKESKRAEGRASKADSPLAFSLQSLEAAIGRKERNRVGNLLADLVEKNPHDIWRIETDRNKVAEGEDVLSYKANGEQRYIVTADKGLVEAFKRIQNPDPKTLKVVDPILSWLHKVIIKWNPLFPLTNVPRDMGVATIRHAIHGDLNASMATLRNSLPAARGAFEAIRKEGTGGKWGDLYRKARDDGALIGWSEQYADVGERIQALEDATTPQSKAAAFGQLMDDMNRATELGTRLATFDALTKAGKPPAQVAMATRRITADFARRGRWAPTYRRLYLFSGANVQGISEAVKSIKDNPARAATVIGTLIGAGTANYAMSRAFGDEDELGKLSESDKARFFGVMIGKRRYGVAAPYGFNIFPYIGWKLGEMADGKADAPGVLGNALVEGLDSFSPLPRGANPIQQATPTVARPFMEIAQNQKFSGAPIAPEDSPFARVKTPASQRYFSDVNPAAKFLGTALHEVSGGTKTKPGLVEISPEWIEHMVEAATGSLGTLGTRTYSVANKVVTGDTGDLRLTDFPPVRPFVQEAARGADAAIYKRNLGEIELAKKQKKAGETVDRPALLALDPYARRIQKAISGLYEKRDAAEGAERTKIELRIRELQEQLNRKAKAVTQGAK